MPQANNLSRMGYSSTVSAIKEKKADKFADNIEPEEAALNELPPLDLCCLPSHLCIVVVLFYIHVNSYMVMLGGQLT